MERIWKQTEMNQTTGDRDDDVGDHVPPSTLSDVTQRIRRYSVRHFLGITNVIAREKAKEGTPYRTERRVRIGRGAPQTHELVFGPWTLAFLAKHSILSSTNHRPDVTEADYFDLIALHGNLNDPIIDETDHLSAYRFLFRTAWEQFTYQEQQWFLLPRYYLLLKAMSERDADRKMDIPAAWTALTGMSIEDFMVLGFGFWSMSMKHAFFDSRALERTKVELLRERAAAHSKAVLDLLAANYDRFRSVQAQYAIPDTRYAKAELNVLRKFPVIRTVRRWDLILICRNTYLWISGTSKS